MAPARPAPEPAGTVVTVELPEQGALATEADVRAAMAALPKAPARSSMSETVIVCVAPSAGAAVVARATWQGESAVVFVDEGPHGEPSSWSWIGVSP